MVMRFGAGLALFVLLAAAPHETPDPPVAPPAGKVTAITDARSAYEAMIAADHWRKANEARDRLLEFGDDAVDWLARGAEHHEDEKIRRRCYETLINHFPAHAKTIRTVMHDGLEDESNAIRSMSAFHLGDQKVFDSFRKLTHVMNDHEANDEWTRYAAAKSLCELGEADGLPLIYDGIGSDWYMPRYLCNLGLKALTGKDVNDFGEGYEWHENAFVSGGVEARMARRPVEDAKRRSARFAAIARYFEWLRDEHPEMYKHVDGGL